MSSNVSTIAAVDTTANPAPLGLMGFGMTTILLNFHNAGLFELNSMIIAMGVFYGGIAQIIAGIMEWKKSNTFGTTAFTSYGLFWLSLVGIWLFPKMGFNSVSTLSISLYLIMWGVFTGFMFIGTFKTTKALMFVFGSLTLLFFLLAIGDLTGSSIIKTIAGIEGIICGASAIYTAMAQVINEIFEETVLPLGPVSYNIRLKNEKKEEIVKPSKKAKAVKKTKIVKKNSKK